VCFIRNTLATLLTLGALAWAANLYRAVGLLLFPEQFLVAMLGTGLALVYLHFPAKRNSRRTRLPWYDAVAAVTGFLACWYVAIIYPDMVDRLINQPADARIVSIIIYILCIEGLRRTVGYSLLVVVLVFSVYALVGHLVPGPFQTRELEIGRLVVYLGLDVNALLGLFLRIAATIVLTFIFFGQLLLHSGGANFFNDISLATMGRYRGGAAKISVAASSLFGSVSGIVVSNIVATGVVTIPLMKRAGFSARLAAAVEATASTGGQLVPPVMGAVAFLMADFLARPYRDIVVAALVPSLLYYVALFIQADLEAAKAGIRRVDESDIPSRGVLRSGWIFILPFVVLIGTLFWLNRQADEAALYASICVVGIGLFIGYRGRRLTLRHIVDALVTTGLSSLNIFMIVAGAGFIIGILQVTGLGFALTMFLVELGGGNLFLLLLIAAIMCIVLGMGMPTVGVYLLLAILIAPTLVEVGIDPLAAHMFILYLGMMSMVTPPVAVAAFFAANIAESEPMQTGFTSVRFGWTAYIVPFIFVFSPNLLLQGTSAVETAIAIVTALVGVWLVSIAMTGYFSRHMGWMARIGLLIAGSGLLLPHEIDPRFAWTNLAGLVLGGAFLAFEMTSARRGRT